jgi:TRAP-type transport system periplasmic protein
VRARFLVLSLGLAAAAAVPAPSSAEPVTIKFATLAPEGTVWMKAIQKADRQLREATGGALRFKIYPGGVAGDEKDTIRKMRLGQLHATGVTGAGMADIVPEVHVLDLPFLFESGEEIDYVLERLLPEFQKRFEDKGFRLLGFTEAGFVYFYSQLPLTTASDFGSSDVKAWLWEGDVLTQAVYEAFGIPSVPLSLPDVLTGLQTGMVNTVLGPPAASVALQWHTKVKHMTPMAASWVVGGTILTEKMWQQLSPEHQKVLADTTTQLSRELLVATREDNRKAYEAMKKLGIQVTRQPTAEEMAELVNTSKQVRQKLVGRLYPQELLDRVEGLIAEYRAQHAAGSD